MAKKPPIGVKKKKSIWDRIADKFKGASTKMGASQTFQQSIDEYTKKPNEKKK